MANRVISDNVQIENGVEMNNLKSVLSSFQFVEGNCVWAVRGQDGGMISSLLFSVGVTAMFPPTESVRSKDHR